MKAKRFFGQRPLFTAAFTLALSCLLAVEGLWVGGAGAVEPEVWVEPEGLAGPGKPEEPELGIPEDSGEGRPRFVAGRILVKLTPKGFKALEKAREGQGGTLSERLPIERLPIEPLRTLSETYSVKEWSPLFPKREGDDLSGLERIYLLSLDPQADVQGAVKAFGALTEWVEYAEPDYLVEIL